MQVRKAVSFSEAAPPCCEIGIGVLRLARESVGRPLISGGEGPSALR